MNEPVSPIVGMLVGSVLLGSLWAWLMIGQALRERRPIIHYAQRQPVPWKGTDVFLLSVTFLGFEILAAGGARALANGDDRTTLLWLLLCQSVVRIAWFAFAVAYLMLRGAELTDLGWNPRHLASDLRTGCWLFLAAIVPVFIVQSFFTQYLQIQSEHPLLQLTQEQPSVSLMIWATIAAFGIAPWFEEFVFRVVLQGWLEAEQVRLRKEREHEADNQPGYAPVVIASLVFAGMHFSAGPDPVAIFVLALFLGYAYRQTHRILPSLVIHAGINGWTMLNLWILYLAAS